MGMVEQPLTQLGWSQMTELSWADLVARGVPRAMADLVRDLGRQSGRPIKVFTMPTMEAGIAGLAVPFLDDDTILFDPCLLEDAFQLADIVVHGLAHILYPNWDNPRIEEYEEMQRFVSVLAPKLLRELPDEAKKTEPMVELALSDVLIA
jgi:predicted SprT family Zn-dependent metalloprotease